MQPSLRSMVSLCLSIIRGLSRGVLSRILFFTGLLLPFFLAACGQAQPTVTPELALVATPTVVVATPTALVATPTAVAVTATPTAIREEAPATVEAEGEPEEADGTPRPRINGFSRQHYQKSRSWPAFSEWPRRICPV